MTPTPVRSTARTGVAAALLIFFSAGALAAIDIFVRSPRDNKATFGEVLVELEVLSAEPIAEVEIRVDGELVARMIDEPWRAVVDVGQENRERHFEFVARDVFGEEARRSLLTPPIVTHMELDLDLQQLYVTVSRGGARLHDLARQDFEILDEGSPQEVVTFERGDVPLTAVLLLDSSFSMRGERLEAALAGARAFVANMRQLDLAKTIVFSDRQLATTPFTSDPQEVGAAMRDVQAAGGTAINDHLFLALKELERHQGRRVVILLSDGVDVESVLDMEDVRWKAGRSQTLLYWIRQSGAAAERFRIYSAWRDPPAHRREISALADLVEQSGGRIHDIDDIDDAPRAFQAILEELREQYVVGYYPSVNLNNGAWHDVQVKVRGGASVRARGGYYDDQL